jgi:cell division protein FtsI (penicillin-binding protein 3)
VNAPVSIRVQQLDRPLFRDPAAVAPPQPLQQAHSRLMMMMLLFMLVTAAIGLRLLQLYVFGSGYERRAAVAVAPRGMIVDRNGTPLATTVQSWAIAVNPQNILGDRNAIAHRLAELLPEKTEAQYRAILWSKRKKFVWLSEQAVPELVQKIHAIGDPGIMEMRQQQRLYPQAMLAGHVLGYSQQVENPRTHKEETTGIGVERFFDEDLKSGKQVRLTLDSRVQAALEGEILRRMGEVSAVGGAGVIMDANNGEVLALASLPSINPNTPLKFQGEMQNKATLSTYELGSTFKMITFANAIESGVITNWNRMFDVSHPLQLGGHTIHDDEPMKRSLSVPEVMTYSSNIGTSLIADELGASRIQTMFRKLGFYDRTNIELRERGMPQVPKYWARTTVMTTSFGHGIAVTPLHLAEAFAALANGGTWHPATLVPRDPSKPVPGHRVISEATSAKMRQLMRLVVLQGTGTNANAPGLRVGGKTGTAEKIVNGHYTKSANITTFAGAFPMDNPRYVVLVVLDDAKASKGTYGFKTAGWMTAPLAKRVVARVAPILGLKPELGRDVDVSDLMPLLLEKKDPSKNVVE